MVFTWGWVLVSSKVSKLTWVGWGPGRSVSLHGTPGRDKTGSWQTWEAGSRPWVGVGGTQTSEKGEWLVQWPVCSLAEGCRAGALMVALVLQLTGQDRTSSHAHLCLFSGVPQRFSFYSVVVSGYCFWVKLACLPLPWDKAATLKGGWAFRGVKEFSPWWSSRALSMGSLNSPHLVILPSSLGSITALAGAITRDLQVLKIV